MKDLDKIKKLVKETLLEIAAEKPRFRAQLRPEPNVSRPSKINRGAGTQPPVGQKTPSNSVWDIVDYLKDNPGSTENEILDGAFGYQRGKTWETNKKYADMLRRALQKGLIQRAEKTQGPGKTKFVYFLPGAKQS